MQQHMYSVPQEMKLPALREMSHLPEPISLKTEKLGWDPGWIGFGNM